MGLSLSFEHLSLVSELLERELSITILKLDNSNSPNMSEFSLIILEGIFDS